MPLIFNRIQYEDQGQNNSSNNNNSNNNNKTKKENSKEYKIQLKKYKKKAKNETNLNSFIIGMNLINKKLKYVFVFLIRIVLIKLIMKIYHKKYKFFFCNFFAKFNI